MFKVVSSWNFDQAKKRSTGKIETVIQFKNASEVNAKNATSRKNEKC